MRKDMPGNSQKSHQPHIHLLIWIPNKLFIKLPVSPPNQTGVSSNALGPPRWHMKLPRRSKTKKRNSHLIPAQMETFGETMQSMKMSLRLQHMRSTEKVHHTQLSTPIHLVIITAALERVFVGLLFCSLAHEEKNNGVLFGFLSGLRLAIFSFFPGRADYQKWERSEVYLSICIKPPPKLVPLCSLIPSFASLDPLLPLLLRSIGCFSAFLSLVFLFTDKNQWWLLEVVSLQSSSFFWTVGASQLCHFVHTILPYIYIEPSLLRDRQYIHIFIHSVISSISETAWMFDIQ